MTTNFLNIIKANIGRVKLYLIMIAAVLINTTVIAAATTTTTQQTTPAPVADPALTGKGIGGGLFENYIIPFSNFLAAAVGIIVVISIIYGAIEYSSAGGDPNKVAKARGRIQKAIVSLIIFFFLYAILQWIVPGGVGS